MNNSNKNANAMCLFFFSFLPSPPIRIFCECCTPCVCSAFYQGHNSSWVHLSILTGPAFPPAEAAADLILPVHIQISTAHLLRSIITNSMPRHRPFHPLFFPCFFFFLFLSVCLPLSLHLLAASTGSCILYFPARDPGGNMPCQMI